MTVKRSRPRPKKLVTFEQPQESPAITRDVRMVDGKPRSWVKEVEDIIKPLLEFFAQMQIEGDILKLFDESHHDFDKMAEMCKDPNAIVIAQLIEDAENFDPDPVYKQAYINWLKLNLLLFTTSPYWRSRIGHMAWHFVCAGEQDTYYPLVWEEHFDPRNWYIAGEPQRPEDNVQVSAFTLPD